MIEMLFYALCCVSVIFMAVTFSAIFGRRFEETAALAVITEALLLFAAGYIKHLSIGVIGVIAISAVGMIVSVCVCLSTARFKKLAVNTFSPGFFAFVILAILIFFMTEGKTLADTNSLGPVADTIRSMIETEGFAKVGVTSGAGIGFQPGYALFGYFFTALQGSFSEPDILRGANIFAAAMILPLINRIRWKSFYIGVFVIPTAVLIPWVVSDHLMVFNSLNADAAAALIFAFMLTTYMCCEQCGYVYWSLGLGSCMLCLTRPGAEFLAAIMLAIVIIDIAALGFFETRAMFELPAKWISVVGYIALTAAGFLSWWIYAYEHQITRIWDCIFMTEQRSANFDSILSQVTSAVTGGGTGSGVHISYILWIVIFAALGGAAAALSEGFWNRIRSGIQMLIVIIGFAAFVYVLAFAYTFIFPKDVNIAETVDIYLTGYILAALLFSVNFVVNKIMDRFETFGRFLVVVFLAAMLILSPLKEVYNIMLEGLISNPVFSLHDHNNYTKVTHFLTKM